MSRVINIYEQSETHCRIISPFSHHTGKKNGDCGYSTDDCTLQSIVGLKIILY